MSSNGHVTDILRRAAGGALLAVVIVGQQTFAADRLTFKNSVDEKVDPSVPVAAEAAVGLALAAPEAANRSNTRLWILAPDEPDETVTVHVNSVDGRYYGKFELTAKPGPRAWSYVELQPKTTQSGSQRDPLFRDYLRDHVAFEVKDQKDTLWLVAAEDPRATDKLLKTAVLVNSLGAESVYSRVDTAPRAPCKRIENRAVRTYDFACEIDLAALEKAKTVRIIRLRGANRLEPTEIGIR